MVFLRLLRFPNLVVVALTQWLVATQILGKAYQAEGILPVLSSEELLLLILATVNLTSAGYVINDLLDYSIDMINRPERVIVGQKIKNGTVRWIIATHFFLGFAFSTLLAFQKDELEWLWLYPAFSILLGVYPRHIKTKPFAGNLFIALCCAGTAGLVWLAERDAWQQLSSLKADQVSFIILLFMVYAFLATWIREIVKDFEDYEGDTQLGRLTMPVYLGVENAKKVVLAVSIMLAVTLLSSLLGTLFQLPIAVVSLCLIFGVVMLTFQFFRASRVRQYHLLSQQWKFFLIGGLILLFLYKV